MSARRAWLGVGIAVGVLLAGACGRRAPPTRYYQLATPTAEPAARGDVVVMLEALETDAAYDDERIAYRTTPYRIDYYEYDRWSAPPGVIVGNYLERALARSGRFRAVVRDLGDAPVIVRGRVLAIEEVDATPRWLGRIVLELSVADARTGEVLWVEQFEETEPLRVHTPEGLAAALTVAMGRISARAAPAIADHADRQIHALRARGGK